MRNKLLLGAIILLITGGSMFFLSQYIAFKNDTKIPEVKKSVEQIAEDNKIALDKTEIDKSKIKNVEDIYTIIHKMANTLIVAEDNLIYGLIPIDEKSINEAMVIIRDTDLISTDEKDVFMNILQEWKNEDYSNGVQAHNYAWTKLRGDIGRAKELRAEYKK